jgi:CheY-like chemotaxis protein
MEALNKLYGRNGEKKLVPAPKVLLLDINMPKMNGIELLKTLRNDSDFSTTSIYILTASYNTEDKLALHDLHPAGCIVKPLEYADALNIFWSLLHERD